MAPTYEVVDISNESLAFGFYVDPDVVVTTVDDLAGGAVCVVPGQYEELPATPTWISCQIKAAPKRGTGHYNVWLEYGADAGSTFTPGIYTVYFKYTNGVTAENPVHQSPMLLRVL